MDASRPADATELIAHLAWVRRLAHALVANADLAEDVAQDAVRVTLEQPAERVGGAQMKSWLRGVVRRLVVDRHRAEASRNARERAVAPHESEPATHEVVARLDQQQRVAQAVRALAEPYRSTILYRYLDELSTREVARRTEVSEELVRKRLERGLAQLRERLDRDFGSETKNWAFALLTLPGVVAVTVKTQLVIAAALVVGVAATWGGLTLRGRGGSTGSRDVSVALAPAAAATAPAVVAPVDAAPSGAVASRTPEPAARTTTPPRSGAGPLRVRVVGSDGQALKEGRLTFAWLDDEPFRDPERAHMRELPIAGETTDIEIPPKMRSGELTASVAGLPPSSRCGIGGALHSESPKEMTITVGASLADPKVTGRILVDGRPEVPRGLRIAVDGTTFSARVHLLDARFEAGPITGPIASLFVTSDETVARQVDVKAGARDVDVDLTRGRTLDLTLLDRATKEPLSGVELYVTVVAETKRESMFKTLWREGSRFVVTDGAGVASVRGIPGDAIVMVRRDAAVHRAASRSIAGHPLRAEQLREPLADFPVDATMADPIEKTLEIDAVERAFVVRGRLAPKLLANLPGDVTAVTAAAAMEPRLEVHWARVDVGEQGRRPDGIAELEDDGFFLFTVDTSGDYRVWAEREQLRLSDVAALKIEAADPDPVELHARAGGELTLRLVHVPAKGFIHIYVEDPGAVFKQALDLPAAGIDIERRIALDAPTWLMAGWCLYEDAALGTSHREEVDPATTSRVEIDLGGDRQRRVELSFTVGAPPPQSQVALFALDRKGETPIGITCHGAASDSPVAIEPGRYLALLFGAPGVVAGEVAITTGPADAPIRIEFALAEHRKADLGAGVVLTRVGSVELDETMKEVATLRFAKRPDVAPGDTLLLPVGAQFTVLAR